MSVPLYMDEHAPRAITLGLRLRGIDVLTAQEDDRRSTPDDILLDRATELGRVLFSQDGDLLKPNAVRLKGFRSRASSMPTNSASQLASVCATWN